MRTLPAWVHSSVIPALLMSAETRLGGLVPQGTVNWVQLPLPMTAVAGWVGLADS